MVYCKGKIGLNEKVESNFLSFFSIRRRRIFFQEGGGSLAGLPTRIHNGAQSERRKLGELWHTVLDLKKASQCVCFSIVSLLRLLVSNSRQDISASSPCSFTSFKMTFMAS